MTTSPAILEPIQRFVRGSLGCQCPDAVFKNVSISQEQDPTTGAVYTRLLIGDRLLIYVLDAGQPKSVSSRIATLTARGRAERDHGNLNRFRLVLSTAQPARILPRAQESFAVAPGHDERTHLHVVAIEELPEGL